MIPQTLRSPGGPSPPHHAQSHTPWGGSSRFFRLLISGCNHCRLDFTVLRLSHRCQLRATPDRAIYSRQSNPFVSSCAGLGGLSSVTPRREARVTRGGDTCSVNGRDSERDCDSWQPQNGRTHAGAPCGAMPAVLLCSGGYPKIPGGDSDALPAAQRSIPQASELHRTLQGQ